MLSFNKSENEFIPAVLIVIFVAMTAAGCSSFNLGEIDETVDHRDDMPGPGILSNEQGSVLRWSSQKSPSSNSQAVTDTKKTDDISEFELYKYWKKLRSEDKSSAEYKDFLEWLEYRKFKAAQ